MSQAKAVTLSLSEKKRFSEIVGSFKKAKILVIGDFILDQFIWGSVDRISPEAPVPVVNVSRESYMLGGSLNVAHNIHVLGGNVLPCGVIGKDAPGRMLRKEIRREGIDTEGIVADENRPTSVKTRVIAHSQQVVRFDREKNGDISLKDQKKIFDFFKSRVRKVDVVVIEDYGKGVINPPLLKKLVALAKKYRKPVLVDPKEKHFPYYVGATVITPNRKEAFGSFNGTLAKSPDTTVDDVGKGLLKKLKCEAVLVTLGEDGMALYEKRGAIKRIPTTAQEVFDVSGAGDTVIAVLSMALAVGAKMKEAAVIANLASGIVVGKLGTASVSAKELLKAIDQYAVTKNGKAKKKVSKRRSK